MAPPRGGNARRPTFSRSGRSTDVTGVLTLEEKLALTSLVFDVVSQMENQVSGRFDNIRLPARAENRQHSLLRHTHNSSDSDKENEPPGGVRSSSAASFRLPNGNSLGQNRAHGPGRGKEPAPMMRMGSSERAGAISAHLELRKELMTVFQKWQNTLIARVKDLSVRNAETNGATSQRGGRGGRGNRGSRGGRGDNGSISNDVRQTVHGGRGGNGMPYSRAAGQTSTPLEGEPVLVRQFPPLPTWLATLPVDKKRLVLHLLLLIVISMDGYPSFSRVFMLYVTSSLHLPLKALQEDEIRLARGLGKAAEELDLDFVAQQKTTESKKSRKWKAAGASLISAPSGGLAEPFVEAGLGTVPESNLPGINPATVAKILGNVAHNGIIVGNIVGIYAGRDTGNMVDQYAKDSADFAFLPIDGSGEDAYRDSGSIAAADRRMRLVVGIGGWLTQADGSTEPFRCLRSTSAETYALQYEVANLLTLGSSLEHVIFRSALWTEISKEMSGRNVFSCLMNDKWPLGMLRLNKVIENPWNIGMIRSEKAGMALAECIGRKIQGDRPVTLVGYSLGARAIYTCLMALAERRQFGLVENVVLLGAPTPADPRLWLGMKSVVHGRLINIFSENDWLLGFLYRTANLEYGVAGLQQVVGVDGVENYNASGMIKGHLRYQYMVGKLLRAVHWEDLDVDQIAEDDATMMKKDKKIRRKRTPVSPHLPVEKGLKPAYRPVEKEDEKNVNGLEVRMIKMKIQG